MSDDYKRVSDALSDGADPDMLCMTCPWDRFCITPPSMTRGEIDAAMEKSKADDEVARQKAIAEGKPVGMPIGSLLSILTVAGKDTQSPVCPVLALRLRSESGGEIVQMIRSFMRGAS